MLDRGNINHPDNHPNPMLRPHGFHEHREDPIVYIETAQMGPSQTTGNGNADGPVVLKRNQACLSCRKRKLKCDAARPHCATCLRSYRHLLKTAPQSNPVLSCEYDDGDDTQSHHTAEDHSGMVGDEDDAEGSAKKKRKSSDGRAAKRKAESAEAEKLKRKIEQLEAQIAAGKSTPNGGSSQTDNVNLNRPWANAAAAANPSAFQTTDPSSPTAFLEMLSSAASVHPNTANMPAGLRAGASESAMFNGATGVTYESSGFTPMFTFEEPPAPQEGGRPETNRQTSGQSSSTRPSTANGSGSGFSPYNLPTPGGPALSPNVVFNFSPGPSGPFGGVGTGPTQPELPTKLGQAAGYAQEKGAFQWPPPPQPQGGDGLNDIAGLLPVDEELQQQLLMDLFWPGWPVNMPEPHIVNDLVEAFFNSVPGLPRLLHKGRFLARMALPPTHSNFPHPSLIHSICSIAANWCEESVYAKSKTLRVPDAKGRPLNFALRQASLAKEAVHDGLNTGNRMFDVVRAMMILSRIFIDDTRMLECWAYNGLVARMILPLGLNVRSAELSLKSVMLPPPADALEREERRAAMWFALYHDTIASSASGWGTSISLDELTIALPCSWADFDSGAENIESNPQDLDSPDFFTRHPVVDPFVLTLKAAVIMNRVNRFARKWKNRHVREDDDLEGMNRPEFRELANAIACFHFPPSLRNVTKRDSKKRLDIDLITAHMLPHAATICLYEPFADLSDPNDANARRLVSSAQSIVSIVQQLASAVGEASSNFTSIMHSSASVCLITAARTSLIFYRHALNQNDQQSANSHRMDVEMIRMALSQFGVRFKIGHHHAQLVEYFLDRATNPTYEKLQAHYPEHPRPGALQLTPNADLGMCVMTALNIKRGYWRLPKASTGVSPFTNTPDSASVPLSSSSASNAAFRFDSNSPHNSGSATSASAGRASMSAEDDARFTHVLKSAMHRWSDGSASGSGAGSTPDPSAAATAAAKGGAAAQWGKLNAADAMEFDNYNAQDKQGQRAVFGQMTDAGYIAKTMMDDAGQRRAMAGASGTSNAHLLPGNGAFGDMPAPVPVREGSGSGSGSGSGDHGGIVLGAGFPEGFTQPLPQQQQQATSAM